jgi:UDP-N-acetylmuramyl pentapeptide synthase
MEHLHNSRLRVALEMDVPLGDIVATAARLKAVTGRGEVVRLENATLVDDSYNSNPRALELALNNLASALRTT